MSIDDVLAELRSRYGGPLEGVNPPTVGLNNSDIERWCADLAISRAALYDLLALHLADGFHRNELQFEFCDSVVNAIHAVITLADEIRPAFFWSVFLAFDEGEYFHENKRDEDPVATYTRPLIAEIIRKHSAPRR